MAAAAVASGYDPDFLGVPAPLPVPHQVVRELAYTHFTVLLDPVRRLAATTGVTIDGAALQNFDRVDDWRLDPRVPAQEQTGEQVYAGNDLDRGHLVRRRDPVWGPSAVARAANEQTFTYTNAAPQAAQFNQSRLLWAGLEDYVLEHARTYRQRLCVFTGPVLATDDPPYRGVQIPRRFSKIAAWATGSADGAATLAATGYVLDQTPELPDLPAATARPSSPANRSAARPLPHVPGADRRHRHADRPGPRPVGERRPAPLCRHGIRRPAHLRGCRGQRTVVQLHHLTDIRL